MITNNLYVIAAICGNFWRESTVNPGVWENLTVGDPGYGLGQWTDLPQYGLTRRTQLFNWLSANGYARDDGIGQLNYLIYENYWTPNSAGQTSAYNTLSDFVQSTSTNLNDLTLEYMYHWEGINDPNYQIRLDYAARFLNLFQNDPGYRMPWSTGNFFNSATQADFNALLIMDFFLGEEPPPAPIDWRLLYAAAKKKRKERGWHIV